MTRPIDQIGNGRMRNLGEVNVPKGCGAMVQPLHREAMQVDEVAWNVYAYQLLFALPVVEMAENGAFYNVLRILDPLPALDQNLPRFEPDSATDSLFEPDLFLCGKFVPQTAFQEKFGVQCSFQM